MKKIVLLIAVFVSVVTALVVVGNKDLRKHPDARIVQYDSDGIDEPLRELAAIRGLIFGSQFRPEDLTTDAKYEDIFLREFGLAVPGNNFKMRHLQAQRGSFDFATTDLIMDYAHEHDLEIHGHALIYGWPKWVDFTEWTRDDLIAFVKEHVRTVVTRYKGRVRSWDVVNEAFCLKADAGGTCILDESGTAGMDPTVWRKVIGPEFIEIALREARAADPNAQLYINENGTELLGPKSDALYVFVKDLKARGVPLDGVGFQMHIPLEAYQYMKYPSRQTGSMRNATVPEGTPTTTEQLQSNIAQNFQRFNDLGLDVLITELDVAIPKTWKSPSKQELADQAEVFASLLQLCLGAESCPSFTIWGFNDKYSWIPRAKPRYDHATPFDEELEPKPAYHAMKRVLSEWSPEPATE